ncbi:MAG: hypothetical protein ACTSW1_07480 [Candidatus Hodarchaeales archaeon]
MVEQTDLREPENKQDFAEFVKNHIQPYVQKIILLSKMWTQKNKHHLMNLFYPNLYTEQAFNDWCRKRFYYWMYNTHINIDRQIRDLTK